MNPMGDIPLRAYFLESGWIAVWFIAQVPFILQVCDLNIVRQLSHIRSQMETASSLSAHSFSDAERLWLESAAKEKPFDARAARARLYDRLPKNFRPQDIDQRFYREDRLTLLGVRVFRPDDVIFRIMTEVMATLKSRILADPTVDSVSIKGLSDQIQQPEDKTRTAVKLLSDHGSFFSGLTTGSAGEISEVLLNGPRGYDGILEFEGVDPLLEEWYQVRRSFFDLSTAKTGFSFITKHEPSKTEVASPKRDTAFVIMPIDPSKPELEDVLETIKQVSNFFGVKAYRADEIEHQDRITNIILNEIRDCDILIADLSYERPNVYYEIGYAHALNKKPILYRRQGTRLHFDLSVHNVPEYRNITELRDLLRRRLEAVLGRAPSGD